MTANPPDPGAAAPVTLTRVDHPEAIGLPAWAKGFALRREADGRVIASGTIGNAWVWTSPKGWAAPAPAPAAKADEKPADAAVANFGVNSDVLQDEAGGILTTNDPRFGPSALSGAPAAAPPSTASACPDCRRDHSTPKPAEADLLLPGAILAGALGIAVFGRSRRS